MRTNGRWRVLAAAVLVAGAAIAIGATRAQNGAGAGPPVGEEVTIVFKRDAVGVGPIVPRHGAHPDPASTNLTGFLVSLDGAWACVRIERFVGAATKPEYDDVWVARDTILLMVRTN